MPQTAEHVHSSAVIIDGHNDSFALRMERGDPLDLTEVREKYHVDLPRLREGGVTCLLYTSDAADDLLCVDLGGRRIIKTKKMRILFLPKYHP